MTKMNLEINPNLSVSRIEEEGFGLTTPAEKQVMKYVATGKPVDEIAKILGISHRTVEVHKVNISQKLMAKNMADITRIWMQLGPTDTNEFIDGSGI